MGFDTDAILIFLCRVIQTVRKLHVFLGHGEFANTSIHVRLYWTGLGPPAYIVEEYMLLAALLHVFDLE